MPGTRTLVRATVVTLVVTMSGSLLGFVRDLLLARFFGADGGTDAFLISWTVPETAFALVVEGGMSLLMIPLFSRAVSARAVVAATFPPLLAVLVTLSVLTFLSAPLLVGLLAPGLADPAVAVTCTRLTSVTVLTFGITGYLSAALRANDVFGPPAAIHLAYNAGIVALMWTLHGPLGVVSAAAGVALGSLLMIAVQLPAFLRRVGLPRSWRGEAGAGIALGAAAPVLLYTLLRQAQVFVERHLGSALPEGTISHLNYAQKVAQIPMLVALLICTVTFPALARSAAAGETEAARRRVEADLRTVTALMLVAVAFLVVYAPDIVHLLLEHGRFTAADTAATAGIMRVYAFGLLGHVLVTAASRPYFAGRGPSWYPAVAMGAGLAVTAVLAAIGARHFGAYAIAAANGIGVTAAAVLLLARLRDISSARLGGGMLRLGLAAAGAGVAGLAAERLSAGAPPALVVAGGGLIVLVVFGVLARLAGVDEAAAPAEWLRRRIRHGR